MAVEVAVDIDVECSECGSQLDVRFHPAPSLGSNIFLSIDPCGNCQEAADMVGYERRLGEEA